MRALDPYDAESFPDLRVESAVVFPAEFIGEAGQFLCKAQGRCQFRRGKRLFRSGFVASITSMEVLQSRRDGLMGFQFMHRNKPALYKQATF